LKKYSQYYAFSFGPQGVGLCPQGKEACPQSYSTCPQRNSDNPQPKTGNPHFRGTFKSEKEEILPILNLQDTRF